MKNIIFKIVLLFAIINVNGQHFPRYNFSEGFELAVTEGRVPGYSTVSKFGVNLAITTATDPEDIWEYGGTYTYDADSTAPIKYISSSSAADTMIIMIEGLDSLGYLVSENILLNGQTNVILTTPLWRVFRMFNNDTFDVSGTVYCHTDDTVSSGVPDAGKVRAVIVNGNNQTLMSLYTIPRGYVGFWYRGEIGIQYESATPAIADYLHGHLETKRYGKVFRVQKSVTISSLSGGYQDYRPFPDPIPALSDIKTTVTEVSATMGAWSTFDILLVEESVFPESYLKSIGQPGY
jgi:hypothetical protein